MNRKNHNKIACLNAELFNSIGGEAEVKNDADHDSKGPESADVIRPLVKLDEFRL